MDIVVIKKTGDLVSRFPVIVATGKGRTGRSRCVKQYFIKTFSSMCPIFSRFVFK